MCCRALSVLAAALLIVAAPAAQHVAPAGTTAASTADEVAPPDQFQHWLDAQAAQALAAGARARAEASTAEEVRGRANEVRREVLDAMGGLPADRTSLNARITGRLDRDGYRIEHLVFESLPGFFVTANLYLPAAGDGRFPAVLGTAGHSDVGKAADLYQHVWVSLARRGVIVLAYDPPGQGERFEYLDPATGRSRVGAGTREHTRAGQQCLLTGTSIARYFAWDGVRALDYLLTRPDVDPARIGVAGNSGGGTQAAWLGVVEPRLSAIDSSCYITSWATLWDGPGPQDMEQVLPGFLSRGLDFADLLIAAAPRPYLVSSAIRDFFPIEGARAAVAEARTAYAALDAADRLGHVEHDGEHGWSQPLREAAYRWFGKWWEQDSVAPADGEGEVTVEAAEALRATPTGQVSTSFQSRTVFDLNLDRARALARTRPPATAPRLRELLQLPASAAPARVALREAAAPLGALRTERLALAVDADLALPGMLVHPQQSQPLGTVLVADGRNEIDMKQIASGWATRGYLTLTLNVRGAGVFAPTRRAGGYSSAYQLAGRAWLLGTSVIAWQTRDLLAGLAFLEREVPGASRERVIHVAGITAPAGLFAAALHPLSAAWVEDGLASYLDLAATRDYVADARLFVPGLLEVTDLPELMGLAAPATVHLVRPAGADGRVLRDEPDLAGRTGGAVPDNVRLDATVGSATAPPD